VSASSQAPAWEFGAGSSSFPSREARASSSGFPSWSLGTSVFLNLIAVTESVGTRKGHEVFTLIFLRDLRVFVVKTTNMGAVK